MPYFPKSGDSWIYPYPNVGPLWEIPIDGYLWVLSSPRIPREHQLNTMGTLLAVHPIVPWENSRRLIKFATWYKVGPGSRYNKGSKLHWFRGEMSSVASFKRPFIGVIKPYLELVTLGPPCTLKKHPRYSTFVKCLFQLDDSKVWLVKLMKFGLVKLIPWNCKEKPLKN